MTFEDTVTQADFKRPILDPSEERVLASLRDETDLAVDGLEASLVSRLLALLRRKQG